MTIRATALALLCAVLASSAGCTCSKASDDGARQTSDAAAATSAERPTPTGAEPTSAPSSTGTGLAAELEAHRIHGLDATVTPSALALDATHLFVADTDRGTVHRIPRDGGAMELLASGQQLPSMVALLGDEIVWLNAAAPRLTDGDIDPKKSGVFRAAAKPGAPSVPVRAAPIVGMVAAPRATGADKLELLFVEAIDGGKRGAISRVTGQAVGRIAEFDGKPMAITADDARVYVATFGATNKSKIVQVPRAGGEQKELTFSGPGFNAIGTDGDQLLGTGIIERKFGLFRVPSGGADGGAVLLAPDVARGVFAAYKGDVYFVSAGDHALKRIPRAGGDATLVASLPGFDATALVVADGWAWIAGKARGDAGGSGAILRFPLRR